MPHPEGFETDINTQNSDEAQNDPFETIEPEKDNPVEREFEIGELGNEELKEDEMTRMKQTQVRPAIINLPSENFKILRFETAFHGPSLETDHQRNINHLKIIQLNRQRL